MSHYTKIQTQFKDQAALIEALTLVGITVHGCLVRFTPEMIEVHEEPQHLYGWHADKRPEKAHVIIRRKFIDSASNDIGFVRQEDGSFQAIISAYDQDIGFNPDWMRRVKQAYAQSQAMSKLRKRGMRVTTRQEGEKIRVVAYGR